MDFSARPNYQPLCQSPHFQYVHTRARGNVDFTFAIIIVLRTRIASHPAHGWSHSTSYCGSKHSSKCAETLPPFWQRDHLRQVAASATADTANRPPILLGGP